MTIQDFTVRWVDSAADIAADDWGRCFPEPLEGQWWYLALERAGLESQFAFAYALVEAGGRIAAIAPTFLMDVPIDLVAPPLLARGLIAAGAVLPRLRYQRTLFVGSPCADEGTVGLMPAVSFEDVAGVLQEALDRRAREKRAPMLVWKDFPAAFRAVFARLPQLARLFTVVSYPGTVLEMPAGGFEGYLQTLSSNRRHNLKKKLKRGAAAGALDTTVVQHPGAEELTEIFGLFWQTYEHGTTKFERLTPAFFETIAKEPVSHFVLLRNPRTAKLAAFMLCFKLGDRVINKFIGLDYTRGEDWFLYFRLWEQALRWAYQQGAREFQSGQTGYRAKLDVGHRLVALDNFCRHQNPIINAIFARIARGISWSSFDADLKTYLAAYPEAQQESYEVRHRSR